MTRVNTAELSEESSEQRRRPGRQRDPVRDDLQPSVVLWLKTLRELLANFGTDKAAARTLDYHPSVVSRWVNGERMPTRKDLTRILRALEIRGIPFHRDDVSKTHEHFMAAAQVIAPGQHQRYVLAEERDELRKRSEKLREQLWAQSIELGERVQERDEARRKFTELAQLQIHERARYKAAEARAARQIEELQQHLKQAKTTYEEARREMERLSQRIEALEDAELIDRMALQARVNALSTDLRRSRRWTHLLTANLNNQGSDGGACL